MSDLNDRQRQAVESDHPRILVIAGAGTGKTRVLTERIARLLDDRVPAEKILAVTFTRAAAGAMRQRVEALVGPRGGRVEIRTMHSWAARLCRAHADSPVVRRTRDFTIWDERDSADVTRGAAHDAGILSWEKGKIDKLRASAAVIELYSERKTAANALDYGDLEALALRLLVEHEPAQPEWSQRYRHVLVDEFQDTNLAQVAILNRLLPPHFFVVGDPRQAVYGWRGAEVGTIIDWAQDASFEVVQLVMNYRSRPEIVRYCNGAAAQRWEPMTSGRTEPGTVLVRDWDALASEPEEVAYMIAGRVGDAEPRRPGDFAVLGRTWAEVSAVHGELVRLGIPAHHAGPVADPWETDEGRAAARAILLAGNPWDDELAALLVDWGSEGRPRCVDIRRYRARALGERRRLLDVLMEVFPEWDALGSEWGLRLTAGSTQPAGWYAEAAADRLGVFTRLLGDGLTSREAGLRDCIAEANQHTLESFRDWWTDRGTQERIAAAERAEFVQCMTIHAAKGLEFPVVVFVGARDGTFPTHRSQTEDEEAMRLYYVACTRARDALIVSSPRAYLAFWGGWQEAEPSPFTARCMETA